MNSCYVSYMCFINSAKEVVQRRPLDTLRMMIAMAARPLISVQDEKTWRGRKSNYLTKWKSIKVKIGRKCLFSFYFILAISNHWNLMFEFNDWLQLKSLCQFLNFVIWRCRNMNKIVWDCFSTVLKAFSTSRSYVNSKRMTSVREHSLC